MKTDSIYPLLIFMLIGGCAYMDKPHADGMPTDIPEQMLFEPPLHNYGCDPIIDPAIVQDERPSAAQIKKRVVHEIREPSFITALVSGIIAYIGFMSIRRLTRRNMGNLGDTPTVKFMPNGNAVSTISIGVSRSWKDQSGQKQTETEWVRVVFFNKLAEIAGEYLKKGSKIYVSGRMKTHKWTNSEGKDQYSTEIIGENMIMLDSKPSDGSAQQQSYAKPQSKPEASAPRASNMPPPPPDYDEEFMDDFPF